MQGGMDVGHVAPEIALVLGAVVVLLTAAFTGRTKQWIPVPIALVSVLASIVSSLVLAVSREQQLSFSGTWALDGVTHGAEILIAVTTAIVLLLGVEWFRSDPRGGEYPAVVLFSAAGAMLLAGAADTMELMVGMLLVSITGYTLAAYHRASGASVEAGMKYFLIGALTNSVLLVGIVFLYGAVGSTTYADTAAALGGADPLVVQISLVCVVVGLCFEIGAVPAHVWVPDVSQAAPVPSAAFLTIAPKIGAVVALARVVELFPDGDVPWRPLIALLAALTMTWGNLLALWQDDLRRLLGWSSVSQAGYALMAVVVVGVSDTAISALVVFLAAYAAANATAFAVVAELRGRTSLDDYRGMGTSRPWLSAALVVALLSLVGVPPLGGFVGKLTVFTAVIDGGYTWLAVVAVANTVASLFYYLRVIGPMYFDAYGEVAPVPVLGRTAAAGAGLALVAVVGVGLVAEPLLDALSSAVLLP